MPTAWDKGACRGLAETCPTYRFDTRPLLQELTLALEAPAVWRRLQAKDSMA